MRARKSGRLNRSVNVRCTSPADAREHIRGRLATIVDEIGDLPGVQAERLETMEEVGAASRSRATRDVEIRTGRNVSAQVPLAVT